MLEPLARSGPARRLAWRHGEHIVHTPLVVTRHADFPGPNMGILVVEDEKIGAQAGTRPVIRFSGGFHARERPDGSEGTWAHVTTTTQDAVQRTLTRLDTLPRLQPLPEFSGHGGHLEGEGQNRDDQGPGSPFGNTTVTTGTDLTQGNGQTTSQNGDAHVCLPAGDQEIAVADLIGDIGHAQRFAARLVKAREQAGPGRLLLAPGVGLVHHAALLVYAGVDLLDTLGVERATHAGWYLTPEGAHRAETLRHPLCACATCQNTAPNEMDRQALMEHNLGCLADELERVKGHIVNDSLRGLVESRVRAHPTSTAVLRQLDRHLDHFQGRWPLVNKGPLYATTQESLTRPDVARYRARIRNDYQPPESADVLLLLPCSATKPYARSQSHKVFRRVIGDLGAASRIHEVVLTSPVGVVPRELENTWPAAHYDVPVTGHWDREETRMIRHQLVSLLAKGTYTRIVSHLDEGTHAIVKDLLPEGTEHTGVPHPTSIPARDRLRRALQEATRGHPAPAWPQRRRADAHGVLSWQLGREAAACLIQATNDVSGRPPGMRLYVERGKKTPLATFVPQRGLFAFTLRAARILYEAGHARTVEIDDFTPRGTLFAVGVKHADPRIVPDDEIVLVHDGEVRGVGRALLTGNEMTAYGRGGAVEVRHHA